MQNKILVLGKGYLGKEFERHGIEAWGRDQFEINYVDKSISGYQLDELRNYNTVINCIGKSNTRWCEEKENFNEALFVNAELPGVLSRFCGQNNIKFVQISTGCLYDDTTKNNTEDDFIAAHCNYTVTKWVGECGCNLEKDLVLRPRLYFSDIKNRNNLLCKLPTFDSYTGDKLDSLTCTSTIVGATKELIAAEQCGIFNVAQIGAATMARLAFWCGLEINGVNTAEALQKAQKLYLVNNTMDVSKLLQFYKPVDIETSVKLSYAELRK